MGIFGKTSPRRSQVRKNIPFDRFRQISHFVNRDNLLSALIWVVFVVLCAAVLSFDFDGRPLYRTVILTTVLVVFVCVVALLYIGHYQKRLIKNHAKTGSLAALLIMLLAATKLVDVLFGHTCGATGSAVAAAIILSLSYDRRFTMGVCVLFAILAVFAVGSQQAGQLSNINLLLTMLAGAVTCCFSLQEIRTRMKLLKVSAVAATMVFLMATTVGLLAEGDKSIEVLSSAGYHAGTTFLVGLLIQSLLPLIEKAFRVATSMTLLDYSDANQPLLKRLAMEAPGTFSHSLLLGSIAEAAAEAISRNGLLCRVGAYYHDIGKLDKPGYFAENEMGSASRHKELSPAMSQLVIVGHVKDGIEMAKEYALPTVLRQFIETHHGTTLIEHF